MTCPKNRFASSLKKQFPWVRIIDVSELAYEFLNEKDIVNTNEEHQLRSSAYWRLLIFKNSHFISYEKILYLDCDTLVFKDLDQSIFNNDINDTRLCACKEQCFFRNAKHDLLRQMAAKGLDYSSLEKRYDYFNSGVLLFNMKNIDKDFVFKRCISLSHMNFTWHDQDVLNIVFYDFKVLDSKFNSCSPIDDEWRLKDNAIIEHMCDDPHAKIPRIRIGKDIISLRRNVMQHIPKNMFFIWIGEKIPAWAQMSIDAFKKLNPDFVVKLIYEKSVDALEDKDAVDCMSLIKHVPESIYCKMYNNPQNIINRDNFRNCQSVRFVDVLKFYLLDKYGGIFLDCDTFPVKPFDDILLQNEFFTCRSLIGKTDFFDDICIFDQFFIGSMPGKVSSYYKGHDARLKPNTFALLKEEALFEYTDRNYADYESLGHDLKYIKSLHQRYYDSMPMVAGIDRVHIKHDWKNRERNYYIDHYNRKSWL